SDLNPPSHIRPVPTPLRRRTAIRRMASPRPISRNSGGSARSGVTPAAESKSCRMTVPDDRFPCRREGRRGQRPKIVAANRLTVYTTGPDVTDRAGRLDRILLGFPGIPARMTFFAWEPRRVALAMGIVSGVNLLPGT